MPSPIPAPSIDKPIYHTATTTVAGWQRLLADLAYGIEHHELTEDEAGRMLTAIMIADTATNAHLKAS